MGFGHAIGNAGRPNCPYGVEIPAARLPTGATAAEAVVCDTQRMEEED